MAPRNARHLGGMALATMAALMLVMATVPAEAETRLFLAHLTGAQETPPSATAAAGDAVVVLDTATNRIDWIVTHTVASPMLAHLHGNGFPGAAAPILIPLAVTPAEAASPIVGSTTVTPQQADDLLSGRWYVNVHSATFTGGEVRGQLASVSGAPVTLFPATGAGPLAQTTAFDLTVLLKTGTAAPVGASVTVNGGDVTSAFVACLRTGTLAGGGQTLRCPLPGGILAPGEYFLSVVIQLSDGSSVGSTATWFVSGNTEP